MDCLFCKIINREIPSEIIYENEFIVVIKDIKPVAPIHVLIIPKKHFANILEVGPEEEQVLLEIHRGIRKAAALTGADKDGFRLINNCGEFGGQTVYHLHFHLIGGVNMGVRLR